MVNEHRHPIMFYDCMDAGGRATQEQLPRMGPPSGARWLKFSKNQNVKKPLALAKGFL